MVVVIRSSRLAFYRCHAWWYTISRIKYKPSLQLLPSLQAAVPRYLPNSLTSLPACRETPRAEKHQLSWRTKACSQRYQGTQLGGTLQWPMLHNPIACRNKITVVVLMLAIDFANSSASRFNAFFIFNIHIDILFIFGAIMVLSTWHKKPSSPRKTYFYQVLTFREFRRSGREDRPVFSGTNKFSDLKYKYQNRVLFTV